MDYESGNIERPVVVGFLYSGTNPLKWGGRFYTNFIATPNGQSIRMVDSGNKDAFMMGLLPTANTLKSWLPGIDLHTIDALQNNHMLGSMELTDEFGLYSISLNTSRREINISSPFGNVNLSAFSGINISAPNGNIKIEGKNVEIAAGNNLKISSGNNINNLKKFNSLLSLKELNKETWIGLAESLASAMVGIVADFVDLSLIRNIVEVFVKPIEGTLDIKSFRYTKIQAAGANAVEWNTTGKLRKEFNGDPKSMNEVVKKLGVLKTYADEACEEFKRTYNEACDRQEQFTASRFAQPTLNDVYQEGINVARGTAMTEFQSITFDGEAAAHQRANMGAETHNARPMAEFFGIVDSLTVSSRNFFKKTYIPEYLTTDDNFRSILVHAQVIRDAVQNF